MDTNGISGGMLSGMASGMLGLEMPLHQQQHQHPHQQHHQMVAFAPPDADHPSQPQQTAKQHPYPYMTKGKQQPPPLSDEDELGFTGDDGAGDGRKRMSQWQRMKWTDNMVRLLIMVVFYIGDDGIVEGNDPSAAGKKKSGGLLQKKGKWKSVSRAMMEKGFYVSPQQCEDKFNDLNKRYKRVNDILGKGTSCKVVENQSLLETMDHISPKMKEEVRKLLNSKHLFFREMCAYHNSCGGGGGGGVVGAHQSSEAALESSHHQQQQQRCFHSPESTAVTSLRSREAAEGLKMGRGGGREEDEDDEGGEYDEEDEDEDEDDDEEEEEEGMEESEGGRGGRHEEEEENYKLGSKKRQRRGMFSSPSSSLASPTMQQLSSELMSVLQDGTKSAREQRQWMRGRSIQLEEQRVSYQRQAFELEKQRLKWVKFSGKKEREMERMKLNNERLRLENERMVFLLRKKELELLDLQQ